MADTLVEAVQSLPPELFNQIYSEVFACECGLLEYHSDWDREQHITANTKLPFQLHINKSIREEFARHYYTKIVLVFADWKTFESYAAAMQNTHLASLSDVRTLSTELRTATTKNMLYKIRLSIGARGSCLDEFARQKPVRGAQEWRPRREANAADAVGAS